MPANARGVRTGGEGCVRAAPRESSTASSNRLHANADASPCQTSLPLLAFQKRHEMTIQPASTRRLGMCARTKYVLRYCECTPPATPATQEATFVSVGASEVGAAQRAAAACAAWIQAARRDVDVVLRLFDAAMKQPAAEVARRPKCAPLFAKASSFHAKFQVAVKNWYN